LDTFAAIEFPKARVCLILNRTFNRHALTPDQIESAIGVSVKLVNPHEPDLFIHAIYSGEPFVLSSPNGAAARVLQDLAYSCGQPDTIDEAEFTPLARTVQARVRTESG
jgi:Flp pilus assembly CpaE family ATPase